MIKTIYSKFVTPTPQKRFILNTKYKPNTKSLFVYYNGLLLVSGDDYFEIDEETIELAFYTEPNDIVIVSPLYSPIGLKKHDHNDTRVVFDEFHIKTHKQEFKLKNRYIPNTNSLLVYKNGIALGKEHYLEIDSQTVYLRVAPELDDVIVFAPNAPVESNIHVANGEYLNKRGNIAYDEFIIKDDGQTFTLRNVVADPNCSSICVYYNGVLLNPDKYTILDSSTIAIKFVPELDDILVVSPVINNAINISKVNGDIVGSRPNSLFKRYGAEERLMNNQQYTLDVKIGTIQHSFTFSSAYSPSFSSVKVIRNDLLEAVDDINDDVINYTIWQNSILVQEIATTVKIDPKAPISAAKNWVRYKTEIDLINSIYINIASTAGTVQKTLGNMQISKSVKIPYLDEMLKLLNKKLAYEEAKLRQTFAGGVASRKANGSSYPVSTERNSF